MSEGKSSLNRRDFLRIAGATAGAAAAGVGLNGKGGPELAEAQVVLPPGINPSSPPLFANPTVRAQAALAMRTRAAQMEFAMAQGVQHPTNGDEGLSKNFSSNYSKGLPHNNLGEVDPAAYLALLNALNSGNPDDFEKIPMGGTAKLTNPQAGLAFNMQGPDPGALLQVPPPAFRSAEQASEMAEDYWMALARDIPFTDYAANQLTIDAAADMSLFSQFKGPKANGQVTPNTLFRGLTPGDLAGPYLSQFFWMNCPFGAESVNRKIRTTTPGVNFLTSYSQWLNAQNGLGASQPQTYDPTPRYMRNGRDLGEWVHVDVLFQGYFNAMLVLFALGAPLDEFNPYRKSNTQVGFGTLGGPYIASLLCGVAEAALKSVWYQKWYIHRRIRPEEFAGRVHNHVTMQTFYRIHTELLGSSVLGRLFNQYGSYLLPMAFAEGCPTHPSYGAGHATVAGACVTLLKALFDESWVLPNPVVPTTDGLNLQPYTGPDTLTVGGELNKLASNVAIGRNIAGVHWRSDATESHKLGEEIAIRYLMEEKMCFNEQFSGFKLTKFDGTTITVKV